MQLIDGKSLDTAQMAAVPLFSTTPRVQKSINGLPLVISKELLPTATDERMYIIPRQISILMLSFHFCKAAQSDATRSRPTSCCSGTDAGAMSIKST